MVVFLIRLLDKYFPVLTPTFLLLGLALGSSVGEFSVIVPVLFAGATFIGSLKIDFKSFLQTARRPKGIIGAMLILRLLMPIIALLFGRMVFPNDIYTQTGLLLFGLLPVAISSVVWTMMVKGNIALTLSVLLLDTILTPIMLPASVLLITGTSIDFDAIGMMMSLLFMVVVPSLVGMSLNQFTNGSFGEKWSAKLGPFAKIFLLMVITINGGNIRQYFPPISVHLLAIIMSIVVLSVTGYLISWLVAKVLKLPDADARAVVFAGGMRNMSTGVVIAVAYFPPAAAIPIVTGIFFQQIVCAMIAKLLERYYDRD